MIYKQCVDSCFDVVKACDQSTEECKTSLECLPSHRHAVICAEVCNMVGRLTAKGLCTQELYELCAKICEKCATKCEGADNHMIKDCAIACKKCAEACRACQIECEKCEK